MVIKVHLNTLLDNHINIDYVLPSPLCIKFAQMNSCIKYLDNNNKYITLLVNE